MVLAKRKVVDLKVTELKNELEKRCADTKGLKGILQKRLLNILEEEGITSGELVVDTVVTPGKKSQKLTLRENSLSQDSQSSKASGDADSSKEDERKTDENEEGADEEDDNKKDEEETPSQQPDGDDEHNVFSRFSTITQDSEDETANPSTNDETAAAGVSAELEDNSTTNGKQEEKMESNDSANLADDHDDDQSEQAKENEEEEMKTTGKHDEGTADDNNDGGASEQPQQETQGEVNSDDLSQEESANGDAKTEENIESTTTDAKEEEVSADVKSQEDGDGEKSENPDKMDTDGEGKEDSVKTSQEEVDSVPTSQHNESITSSSGNDLNKHKFDTSDVVEIGNEFLDTLDYDLDATVDCGGTKEAGGSSSSKVASSKDDVEESTSAASTDNLKISSSPKNEGDERSKGGDSGDKSDIKNLWVAGLSSTTKASKLKAAFSEHGKVVGAKIVTSSRSPGSECFGFVAMATVEAADMCVKNMHNADLDGMKISVEKRRNLPGKRNGKDSYIDRSSSARRSSERKSSQPPSTNDKKSSESTTARDRDSRTRLPSGPVDRDHRRLGSDRHSDRYRERNTTLGQDRDRRRRSKSGDRGRSGYRGGNTDAKRSASNDMRKRPRLMDQSPTAPRKVVIDSSGGGGVSLRVNVSSRDNIRDNRRDHPPPTSSRTMRRSPPPPHRPHHAPAPSRYTSRDSDRRGADYHRRASPPPPPRRGMSPPRGREGIRGRDPLPPRASTGGGPSYHPPPSSYHRDMVDTAELARVRREEREKVEREKRLIEKERQEQKRLEMERIKIENEKKKMVATLARERDELHNLKNSLDNSHREHLKRPYYVGSNDMDLIRSKRSNYDDNNSRHQPPPTSRFSNYETRDNNPRDRGRGGGDHVFRSPVSGSDLQNMRGVGESRGSEEMRPRGSVSSAPTRASYDNMDRSRRSGGDGGMGQYQQSPSSSSDSRYRSNMNTNKMDSYQQLGSDERRITSGQTRDSRPRHHDIDAHDERKVVSRDNRGGRSTAQPSRSPVYGGGRRSDGGSMMTSSSPSSRDWHSYRHDAPPSGEKMRGVTSRDNNQQPQRDDLREEIRRPQGSGGGATGGGPGSGFQAFNDFMSSRRDDDIRRRSPPPTSMQQSRGGRGMGSGKPIPTQTGGGGNGGNSSWNNSWSQQTDNSGVKSSYGGTPSGSRVSLSQGLSKIGSLVGPGSYGGAGGGSSNQPPQMNMNNNSGGGGGMSNRMPNPLLHVDPNHRYNSAAAAQYKPMQHRY